ncbi:MAG: YicC family protein [Spirochaetaceae bacterium]|nr:MAG: YicC family protein [Spirochaetaceae bacterium]
MKSMTGFGYADFHSSALQASLEIKSYNNRYLDVSVVLPGFVAPLEPEIRAFVAQRVSRGRVEVTLRLRELQLNLRIHIDEATVGAYGSALERLREVAGLDEPVTIDHLLRFEEVVQVEKERRIDDYRTVVHELLQTALVDFDARRVREGDATQRDIRRQLERLTAALEVVAGYAPQMEEGLRRTVQSRFSEVLGDEVDTARVYAETASLLVKYSINEELARMGAHLESLDAALSESGALGKRLDFVCQEINREINTIGSKSFVLDISRQVVEMKDALENIREQLRNVE